MCRDEQAVQEYTDAAIALATEQGFPFWLTISSFFRGWALTKKGDVPGGIAQMCQSLADFRAIGSENGVTQWLALLAEAHGRDGQPEKGLATLAEALAFSEKNKERNYEAELHRLKGELTLQKLSVVSCQLSVTDPRLLTPDSHGEAEACFLKALEISSKQQAKSLELRAAMSLARLWQKQGKRAEAHKLLSEVYNWFTEGFDTKDLQEAKALLDGLKGKTVKRPRQRKKKEQ
jgi:adenylate cyclase